MEIFRPSLMKTAHHSVSLLYKTESHEEPHSDSSAFFIKPSRKKRFNKKNLAAPGADEPRCSF